MKVGQRLVLSSLVVVALSLSGCVSIPILDDHVRTTGVFVLYDSDTASRASDSFCEGAEGFDDIFDGTSVRITSDDKTVAVAELEDGHLTDEADGCVWTFEVNVPKRDFYDIEVSHRGVIPFSLKEIQNGEVGVTLGTN